MFWKLVTDIQGLYRKSGKIYRSSQKYISDTCIRAVQSKRVNRFWGDLISVYIFSISCCIYFYCLLFFFFNFECNCREKVTIFFSKTARNDFDQILVKYKGLNDSTTIQKKCGYVKKPITFAISWSCYKTHFFWTYDIRISIKYFLKCKDQSRIFTALCARDGSFM